MDANYDAVLRDIADRFAPEHDVRRFDCGHCRRGLTPTAAPHVATVAGWNVNIDGLAATLTVDRAYVAAAQSKLKLFQAKRDAYWLARAREDGPTGKLWRTLNSVLAGRNQSAGERSTSLSADGFADLIVQQEG